MLSPTQKVQSLFVLQFGNDIWLTDY